MQWSDEQTRIFEWFARGEGHLVVRARAGTGKTTTILEAVRHAPERRVLLAAFNKIIATELQQRLTHPGADAKTLHALGFAAIRRHRRVRVDANRRVRGLVEAVIPRGVNAPRAIRTLIGDLHTKVREVAPFATFEDVVDVAYRFDMVPNEEVTGWSLSTVAEAALAAVDKAAESVPDVIDFADMIFLPLRLALMRPTYNLVVVDEAQDMTGAQLDLARRACRPGGRIAVVGDDRQAIYAFRGADAGALDRLKDSLGAQELTLSTTYRCPKAVVELAQRIVPDYHAAPSAPQGLVEHCVLSSVLAGGEYQAAEGDFVLSRTNAPLAKICLGLLRRGVRATVRGRDIGKTIRTLIKRLEARTLQDLPHALDSWAQIETAKVERDLERERISERTADNRSEYIADQHALICSLCDGLSTLAELNARVDDLFSDSSHRAQVICSTVHRAKGLEAECVYLLQDTFRDTDDNEEKNIRYVGITRTKDTLFLVRGEEAPESWQGDGWVNDVEEGY